MTTDTAAGQTIAEKPVQCGGAGFSVVVALPSYRLSPNGTRNRYERARLAKAAKDEAALSCLILPEHQRPLWPRGTVTVRATIVLPKGQRRLDQDGAIGLLKSTIDGCQGYVIANDRQLEWEPVCWERDARLRQGMVRLEFWEVAE
jgi:hypothetical protein